MDISGINTNLTVFYEIRDEMEMIIEVFSQTYVKKILESASLQVIAYSSEAKDFEYVKLVQKHMIDSKNRQIEKNKDTNSNREIDIHSKCNFG